jgi:steroid 5-alpha reductase family enzyme
MKRSLLICLAAYITAAAAAVAVGQLSARASPLWAAAFADLAATLVIFAFSLALDNSSLYDPYWSVAPAAITLYWLSRLGGFGGFGGAAVPRQIAVAALVLIWSARLTWNWLRQWRGLGDEDWRYADYRRLGAGYWPVSFLGFHLMPTIIVFLGCLSLLPALSAYSRGPGLLDALAVFVTAAAVGIEAVADQQLRRFKANPGASGRILDRGLWAILRHPNYFGEVMFWWGLWLFAIAADPSWWWTVVGPCAITALFLGVSAPMMNRRMARRRAA